MRLTDEERLGMIAAQQLDAHMEEEEMHRRWERELKRTETRRAFRLTLENAVIAVMPPPDEESRS